MKVLCNKCGNEFIFTKDNYRNGISMVRCPVCKNPIAIKSGEHRIPDNKNEKYKMRDKQGGMPVIAEASMNAGNHRNTGDYANRGNITGIQQDLIHQIENGSDSIIDTSDNLNDSAGSDSYRGPWRNGGLVDRLQGFAKGLNLSILTDKFIPCFYYAISIFVVFTALFLFSALIKLEDMHVSIGFLVNSIVHGFKHI